MAMTVVGIFDDVARAHTAVEALASAGYDRGQISIVRNDGAEGTATADRPRSPAARAMAERMDPDAAARRTGVTPDFGMASAGEADTAATFSAIDADPEVDGLTNGPKLGTATGAVTGAGAGVVVGGGVGLLAGAAGLFIPGLGAVLGIGPLLATIVGGAGIGAVAGGLTGALINAGIPDADAAYYTEGVRRGGTLVTVVAGDEPSADRAADILDDAGAYDVNERAATWAETTAPVGGNTEVPALSTVPESSMTADVPVVGRAE